MSSIPYKGPDIADRPTIAPAQVQAVLSQVGNDVALAAQALGVDEADVAKSVAVAAIDDEADLDGFSPAQKKMALNQIATLALIGENHAIQLNAAKFIVSQSTVSAESKFKAKHGVGNNTGVQFLIAIQQAKEKVRTLYA